MADELSIVMYHYVRPITTSKYKKIKGLELDGFVRQLDHLEENFNIVSSEEVIAATKSLVKLPQKACWLTFDDGYKDHYEYVLPELLRRNLTAAFFPPRDAIKNSKMLSVNSIHYILACSDDIYKLVLDLDSLCLQSGISDNELDKWRKIYWKPFRYDNEPTIYFKRMLQHVLPETLRTEIIAELFERYVGTSEKKFSEELYMNISQVSELIMKGMYVGSHGTNHHWLGQLSDEQQNMDISQSLEFLEEVGTDILDWIMCYPFGSYNKYTLSLLADLNAAMGITSKLGTANLKVDNPFELPRLDTNFFPQ